MGWDSIVDLKDAINLQDLGLAIKTVGMLPFAPKGVHGVCAYCQLCFTKRSEAEFMQ